MTRTSPLFARAARPWCRPTRNLRRRPARSACRGWANPAFKITTATGKVIVIDPYLTANPKTPEAYKKKYIKALGNAPVKVLPIKPGDALEF